MKLHLWLNLEDRLFSNLHSMTLQTDLKQITLGNYPKYNNSILLLQMLKLQTIFINAVNIFQYRRNLHYIILPASSHFKLPDFIWKKTTTITNIHQQNLVIFRHTDNITAHLGMISSEISFGACITLTLHLHYPNIHQILSVQAWASGSN